MGILDVILGPITGIINKVIDKQVIDKAGAEQLKNEIQAEMIRAEIQGELAQLEINKTEAANPNMFVAGWRPYIGWVCGAALSYQYVIAPIAVWVTSWAGLDMPTPPKLDDVMWQLMFGMLGMGTLRTYEKAKGIETKGVSYGA